MSGRGSGVRSQRSGVGDYFLFITHYSSFITLVYEDETMALSIPTGSGPGHHGHRRGRPKIRRSSSIRRRTNAANRIPRTLPPHPEDAAAPLKPPLLESSQKPIQD